MVLTPRIIHTRLLFLLDTPLLALVTLSFTFLTFWKDEKAVKKQWLLEIAFGMSLGLGLLTKQSILFYLFFPILGLSGWFLWRRKWLRLGQLLTSFLISIPLWFPWYRTNWIYLFSTAHNSNAGPASLEGDPAINTLAAWIYYWRDLPLALSWVWLIPPLVGLGLAILKRFPAKLQIPSWTEVKPGFWWLSYYVAGTYFICSALYNKDSRYIVPYLPILAILLAYGLTRWCGRWLWVRWATLAIAVLVTMGNLFPIPGSDQIVQKLSPDVLFRPELVKPAPNEQVIQVTLQQTPYQQINLGVIPNTHSINPNTLNYFGGLQNFRAYGRELSGDEQKVLQDQQNFDWFLTKTGENGNAQPAQLALAETLPNDPNFIIRQQWTIPDDSQLTLFQRQFPRVEVRANNATDPLPQLTQIELPAVVPPGQPVPITYHWTGDGQALGQGLLLLTWQNVADSHQVWFHDHAIGLGELLLPPDPFLPGIEVVERTAMLPSADLPAGEYQLRAQWLDPETQTAQSLPIPPVTLRLDAKATAQPAPPLDYVSQLFHLSQNLRQGPKGLEPVFAQVDRLNLYDPRHDYLRQSDQTLTYRLSQNPLDPLPLAYAQVLSRVLQENPRTAIAALQNLVQLDPKNPYAHAYLAFVYLYDWQGRNGEQALQPALQLAPDSEEIQALQAIAFLMQGKLIPAWQTAQPLLQQPSK
jgi:4-amino-4-deoxy-L-arabinose transferase-like glycosyltransferase